MEPRQSQLDMAEAGFAVLKEYGLVYLAAEERTGKTISSLLIAEKCKTVNSVLVVTKKKPLADWLKTIKACNWLTKDYTITNYHQAIKECATYDLVILDEAHNYIAASPKPSAIWKAVKKLTKGCPLIFISATPHAQGYQQLFHQFALSDWSPWKQYKSFYAWFKMYGIPSTVWVQGKERDVYTKTKEELIKQETDHLFVTKTRKDLGFEHEPQDQLHYVELSEETKELYNKLMKDRLAEVKDKMLVCDSASKLRYALHMLEGGVAKIDGDYISLDNNEKIDFIKATWGDTTDLVIFYQYIEEGNKLRKYFKNATILQGTSFAEGIDLSHIKTSVIYSQDWSTARHTQRRARQANFGRNEEIIVHYLLVAKGISEQVYQTVSVNKINFVNSVFEETLL